MENHKLALAATLVALTISGCISCAPARFRSAQIDSMGRLRVALSNNQIIEPAKDSDQVGFEQITVSTDRRIVGWVALYPNCCTSYPIPLKLVLLDSDGRRTVISNDLPIWQWAFAPDGKNIVIRQAPVHGPAPMYYELHDIHTGRLVASAQIDSTHVTALPEWITRAIR